MLRSVPAGLALLVGIVAFSGFATIETITMSIIAA
jgi:hypothetical protein